MPWVIGVISDTHGLVRPQALSALAGVDAIVHAGDIGGAEVIEALGCIAPVTAIRGNNDRDAMGLALPATRLVDLHGAWLYLLHDLHDLDLDPAATGIAAVITGHSHVPRIEEKGGILYLNPGSAGPRRFRLPVTVARLSIYPEGERGGARLSAELLHLAV